VADLGEWPGGPAPPLILGLKKIAEGKKAGRANNPPPPPLS